MVQMYKLCSEQLSQQDHYDFGMRAVKSVLVMAGSLKRASPDVSEDITLIRALKDSNLPKFLADDALLFMVNSFYSIDIITCRRHQLFTSIFNVFQGILGDLFPGIVLPDSDYGDFDSAIVESQIKLGFQPEVAQKKKVIQLHETMIVRWGVMLVGPTGGGKSSVLKVFIKARG